MALRSSWDGFLRLSLISVPVRAYNAAAPGGGDIHFNQIHKDCGERIRYQKVCPVHGEITKDDIVSGYEHEKGKYVTFEREELSAARSEDDEAINIEMFTALGNVDPVYLSGKTFYLAPSGPAGQKPYVLLHEIMKDKDRCAIGTVVLSGHDEIVLIRPEEKLLTMTVLYHEHELKKPSAFEDEVGNAKVTAQELKLAGTLVDASTTDELDLSRFKDHYAERITQLVEAKLSGQKIEAPRLHKAPGVINLMDALKQSLDQAKGAKVKKPRGATAHRPARASHGRRKTG